MIFFFFFSKESESEKTNCFLFEGVKVREDWLVSEFVLQRIQIFKKEKKNFFFYFFFFRGGGGVRGG